MIIGQSPAQFSLQCTPVRNTGKGVSQGVLAVGSVLFLQGLQQLVSLKLTANELCEHGQNLSRFRSQGDLIPTCAAEPGFAYGDRFIDANMFRRAAELDPEKAAYADQILFHGAVDLRSLRSTNR